MNNTTHLYKKISASTAQLCRCYCSQTQQLSNAQIRQKRSQLFGQELARQAGLVSRVEKIKVEHRGPPEDCTLLMNKGLSTPFNCAMHIQELLMTRSVVALVNGQPWDMHRPLEEDCDLQFLHFKDEDPRIPNEIFWRSCSFLLGYILESAFKDDVNVELCSFPPPSVKSGSFVYDADLKLPDWKPTSAEMNCLSRMGAQRQQEDTRFERLEVDASVAFGIFEDNRYKSAQIPAIAADSRSGSSAVLYRLGQHVDISKGPMMSSTQLLARFSVTAVHDIESETFGPLKRIQGIATPKQLPIHYWAYNLLCERAAKLNPAPRPILHQAASHLALES